MTPLLVGAAIAAVALVFVLLPLLSGEGVGQPRRRAAAPEPVDLRHEGAIQALREIEFDRATGKLSDADYAELKADYTAQAVAVLQAADAAAERGAAAPAGGDAAEALVRALRARVQDCGACGLVPTEPDALYCSGCGHYLKGGCGQCGAPIVGEGARFCTACGWRVAA
jgi:hypothetical protein